jgi:hypothetical protein
LDDEPPKVIVDQSMNGLRGVRVVNAINYDGIKDENLSPVQTAYTLRAHDEAKESNDIGETYLSSSTG